MITPEKWAQLERSTPKGTEYDRKILGLWVDAEGVIWNLDKTKAEQAMPDVEPRSLAVAVDVGSASVTHALLIASYATHHHVIDEWRHDRNVADEMRVADMVRAIAERFNAWGTPQIWIVDPAAHEFIVECRAHAREGLITNRLSGAQYQGQTAPPRSVRLGIETVNRMFWAGQLKISPKCKSTLQSIASYVWCSKAALRGEDKPLKDGNDHAADALRYWCAWHNNNLNSRPAAKAQVHSGYERTIL